MIGQNNNKKCKRLLGPDDDCRRYSRDRSYSRERSDSPRRRKKSYSRERSNSHFRRRRSKSYSRERSNSPRRRKKSYSRDRSDRKIVSSSNSSSSTQLSILKNNSHLLALDNWAQKKTIHMEGNDLKEYVKEIKGKTIISNTIVNVNGKGPLALELKATGQFVNKNGERVSLATHKNGVSIKRIKPAERINWDNLERKIQGSSSRKKRKSTVEIEEIDDDDF